MQDNQHGRVRLLEPEAALQGLRRGEGILNGISKAEIAAVDAFLKHFANLSEGTSATESGSLFHVIDAAAVRMRRTTVLGTAETRNGTVRGILVRNETAVLGTFNPYLDSSVSIGMEMLDRDGEPARMPKRGFDLISVLFGQNGEADVQRRRAEAIDRMATRPHDAVIEVSENGVKAVVTDKRLEGFVEEIRAELDGAIAEIGARE
jgi:hypothetical protein